MRQRERERARERELFSQVKKKTFVYARGCNLIAVIIIILILFYDVKVFDVYNYV